MRILRHKYQANNVGKVERAASILTGALLFSRGLQTKGWLGTGTALLGVAFMRRGLTGFCYTYQALGLTSAGKPSASGVLVDEAITINLPREEVYRFWRNLANMAPLMQHVESVHTGGESNRSHWIIRTPAGKRLEWDAELVHEKENEMIAWRSLDESEIPHSGTVRFKDAAGGRGTEVKLELRYGPPPFGEEPSGWIRQALKRLKARIEAGVFPETDGQPAGANRTEEDPGLHDTVSKASEESFPASDSPAFIH